MGCFLHESKPCLCEFHCTGCRHAYGPVEIDCCTCCKDYANGD